MVSKRLTVSLFWVRSEKEKDQARQLIFLFLEGGDKAEEWFETLKSYSLKKKKKEKQKAKSKRVEIFLSKEEDRLKIKIK